MACWRYYLDSRVAGGGGGVGWEGGDGGGRVLGEGVMVVVMINV